MEVANSELPRPATAADELPWLHVHEYTPWGVQIAASHDTCHGHSAPVHYGIANARAALITDNVAVVVGGRNLPTESVEFTCRTDLFDVQETKWLAHYDIKGDMLRRQGHSVVSLGTGDARRAIVFGGEELEAANHGSTITYLGDCYELSYANNIMYCSPLLPSDPLSSLDSIPNERAWHTATAVTLSADGAKTDAVLVLGGVTTGGAYLSDGWALSVEKTDGVVAKWTPVSPTGTSPLPLAFHHAAAVSDGGEVVVIGGRRAPRGAMLDGVYILDINANTWSQLALTGPSPPAWTARCCLSALSVFVPLEADTRRLMQIKKNNETKSDSLEDACQILVFGGFATDSPVTDPTRIALLDPATGAVREVHAPNLGLTTYLGQASLTTPDAKSLFVFGGVDARARQYTDTVSAIHFWKPQPGSRDEDGESNQVTNGVHTKQFDNGDEYTGEMDAQRLRRQGQGRCVYHNGGVYEGEWLQDERSGQGVMTYANGDTYTGQWQQDKRHGTGMYEVSGHSTASNRYEQRYDGQWAEDAKMGSGIATFSDGSVLTGTWKDGVLATQSVRLDSYDDGNGVCTYIGEVLDGLPRGQGESKHVRESYAGGWLHGKRSGQGMLTLYDGTTYRGDWKNGKKNGFGVCEYARTKDKYDGKWVGGVRCGRGRCTYANGCVYDGEWRDDKCHGVGRYTFADGTFYDGNWHENKFYGDGALVFDLDEPLSTE